MNKEEIIDKILRNKPLTEIERSWWEEHKDEEETLHHINFMREMQDPLRLENRKLLKEQLQEIEKNDESLITLSTEHVSSRIFTMRRWISVAAALLVLVLASVWLFQNKQTDYFAAYFAPYPSIVNPVLKGESSDGDILDKAMAAYQNRNYQESLNYLDQLLVNTDTISFYKANVLLTLERSDEALALFENLSGQSNRFTQEAQWYEALTLLHLKRKKEAIHFLNEIGKTKIHPYFSEAEDLLKKIQ